MAEKAKDLTGPVLDPPKRKLNTGPMDMFVHKIPKKEYDTIAAAEGKKSVNDLKDTVFMSLRNKNKPQYASVDVVHPLENGDGECTLQKQSDFPQSQFRQMDVLGRVKIPTAP